MSMRGEEGSKGEELVDTSGARDLNVELKRPGGRISVSSVSSELGLLHLALSGK